MIAKLLHDTEPENAATEGQRTINVGDFEVDVADGDGGMGGRCWAAVSQHSLEVAVSDV